ncbi:hypothetical protein [Kutzneria chonburiensis]|uniref:hypothetical protein n=1 Tax=Kutzneria chonburiensis TaxID=1483604 RepID=UPI0023614E8B|nr:hypothetical protein [Kutzneria chonburiensis]
MRTFEHGTAVWDVATPQQPGQVAGVTMAGFRLHDLTALRMVPHPAVTLLLEFGAGSPVLEGTGRQHRGCLVAGPGFGSGERSARGARTSNASRCDCPR